MTIAKFTIKGKYEDGYLYDGSLFLISVNRELVIQSLDSFVAMYSSRSNSGYPLLEYLLQQNSLLHKKPFGFLIQTPSIRKEIQSVLNELESKPRIIDLTDSSKHDLLDPGMFINDVLVYYNSVYISSTNRLQSAKLSKKNNSHDIDDGVRNRYGTKCYTCNVFMGALHSSLGDEGLWTKFYETSRPDGKEQQTSSSSVSSDNIGVGLLNFESRFNVKLYETAVSDGPLQVNNDMTAVGEEEYNCSQYWQLQKKESNSATSFAEKVGGILYLVNEDGEIFFSELSYRKASNNKSAYRRVGYSLRPRLLSKIESDVLSVHPIVGALVVKALDGVYVINKSNVRKIFNKLPLTVRTFPKSIQYRNVILIADEDETHLYVHVDLDLINNRAITKGSFDRYVRGFMFEEE